MVDAGGGFSSTFSWQVPGGSEFQVYLNHCPLSGLCLLSVCSVAVQRRTAAWTEEPLLSALPGVQTVQETAVPFSLWQGLTGTVSDTQRWSFC